MIDREVRFVFGFEFIEPLRVLAVHPPRGRHIHGLELAIDAVFGFQSLSYYFKLQNPDRTENQIVVHQRAIKLRRALFAQLT